MIVSRAETSGHCFREDAGTKNPNSSAVNPQQQLKKFNEFWTIGSLEWATFPIKVLFAPEVALANPLSMLSIGNKTALLDLIIIGQIANSNLAPD